MRMNAAERIICALDFEEPEEALRIRAATPQEALQAGADYLVIGQPIIRATDPRTAALKIIKEIS